ncbi:hypothetical protein [Bradyrhizobium sp.]|uniref:hypothetical protein n=1 Tax=Bradyrhizobium sp. TaxID=376 RepID=UPI00262780FE|nr:hypothetical protein [Bradyrhizobium sp.]
MAHDTEVAAVPVEMVPGAGSSVTPPSPSGDGPRGTGTGRAVCGVATPTVPAFFGV